MIELLQREWIYLWYYFSLQFRQIFQYYLLGMMLGSVISVFGKGKIQGFLGKLGKTERSLPGILMASLLGIASPLCMYGTIPLAASLSKKGMRDDILAAFMMSSVLLNPQLLIYTSALGRDGIAVRFFASLLCGLGAGLAVHYVYGDKPFFNFHGFGEPSNRDTDENLVLRLVKNMGRNLRATGPMVLLGILLSALFQRYVPASLVSDLFGSQEGFGVLMAATIGVPLYACGGGTIPLLQQWLAAGMSMGSAAAFMITGPATKITNLGALKIVLGGKRFLGYLLYVAGFSLAAGQIVEWFYL